MNIVKQRVLERVTDVDIHLRQRFARRAVERVLRLLSRVSSQYGPRSSTIANGAGNPIPGTTLESEDYVTGSVLSGLEVFWMAAAGSTLRVSAGAVLVTNPAPGNEARPVPWTGQVENDDDAFGVYDAPLYANVTPTVPIAGALAQPEWWIVYGTPSEATIETDTNSAVFNESTGVFDVTTQPKIVGHQLARAVLRGSAGATLNATLALLPANAVQLAWVYVPTGSTDLASATIFDVRRLALAEQGPNIIEGRWQNVFAGEAIATLRVFKGDVRARHWNEWLMARMTNGVLLSDIAEPGADWGGASQTFNPPKIAYVYLCRVEGVVPRRA